MDAVLTAPRFLTSPIVEIVVGRVDNETVFTAHQTLLLDSPFLSEIVDKFEASGPVSDRFSGRCPWGALFVRGDANM